MNFNKFVWNSKKWYYGLLFDISVCGILLECSRLNLTSTSYFVISRGKKYNTQTKRASRRYKNELKYKLTIVKLYLTGRVHLLTFWSRPAYSTNCCKCDSKKGRKTASLFAHWQRWTQRWKHSSTKTKN